MSFSLKIQNFCALALPLKLAFRVDLVTKREDDFVARLPITACLMLSLFMVALWLVGAEIIANVLWFLVGKAVPFFAWLLGPDVVMSVIVAVLGEAAIERSAAPVEGGEPVLYIRAVYVAACFRMTSFLCLVLHSLYRFRKRLNFSVRLLMRYWWRSVAHRVPSTSCVSFC